MVDGLLTIWFLAHIYPNLRRVSPITYTAITPDHTHLLRRIYPKAFRRLVAVLWSHVYISVAAHLSILCLRGGFVLRGTPRISPDGAKESIKPRGGLDAVEWASELVYW